MFSKFFSFAGIYAALLIGSAYFSVYSMQDTMPLLKVLLPQHSKKNTAHKNQGTRRAIDDASTQKENLRNEHLQRITSLALSKVPAQESEKDSLTSPPQIPSSAKNNSIKPLSVHQQDLDVQQLYEILINNAETVLQNQMYVETLLNDFDSFENDLEKRHRHAAEAVKPLAHSPNSRVAINAQLFLGTYYLYGNQFDISLSYLKPLVQQNKDLWAKTNAWYYIGSRALFEKRYKDLKDLIDHSIEENCNLLGQKKKARLWIMLAEYYWEIKDVKAIIKYCQYAINQKDCDVSRCYAFTTMAALCKLQDDLEWARYYVKEALAITNHDDIKKTLTILQREIEKKQSLHLCSVL